MNTIKWPIRNSILASLLGLAESSIRAKQKQIGHKLKEGVHFSRVDLKVPNAPTLMTVWYREGAIKLALRCRKAKAHEFLESEGVIDREEVSDESRTLDTICEAIKGFTPHSRQYPVGPYKIDLYLRDLKIVVECDEMKHRTYSKLNEAIREQFIKEKLDCKFLRYDPARPEQVGGIINKIIRSILR